MGNDGWIGLSWPKSLGGKEFSPIEQYIFVEEIMRTGFPFPFLTTESVGPMIANYGSDFAKENIAKRILTGELIFAIGYSEPNAGTDLASLTTRADKSPKGWMINGQKIWTSLANFADYVWLAARTNQGAKKNIKEYPCLSFPLMIRVSVVTLFTPLETFEQILPTMTI
jgi:alkylation response protein AidB-like acyl-CoA dehydrogenase